jgi:hypothetical protein
MSSKSELGRGATCVSTSFAAQSSLQLWPANPLRSELRVAAGPTPVALNFGVTAVTGIHRVVAANSEFVDDNYVGQVQVVAAAGTVPSCAGAQSRLRPGLFTVFCSRAMKRRELSHGKSPRGCSSGPSP